MIDRTIMRLTVRQLLGQKRTLLMLGFALLPVLIALLFRLNGDHSENDPQEWTAKVALASLVVGLTLPFTALVFGTAALGQEFEDGTAVYLLSKPIPRTTIVLSKLLVAWLATCVVVLIATIPTGFLALSGEPGDGIVIAFAVAVVAGALIYCSAFLWLSIATSLSETAAFALMQVDLDDVLLCLTAREARIVRLRYGLDTGQPLTLKEVGRKFNLTRERIRQIEQEALGKLRQPHRQARLLNYLQ